MGVELLESGMILEDVLNQGVDVVADGVDLAVYIVKVDLVGGHLILLGQLHLAARRRLLLLSSLPSCNFDALSLQFNLELNAVRQLIQLCLDPLLSDHFRNNRLRLTGRNIQLLSHGLKRNIQIDA